MKSLRTFWLRLASIFDGDHGDRELAGELESHVQLHIDDNLRAGMPLAEARRHAVLALGGIEQTKERYRDRRGLPIVNGLQRDVRFGLRMFRKHPGFTCAAVLTLALGIGATTGVFTLANWILLRPVPGIREPQSVSIVWTGTPNANGSFRVSRISYPNYRDLAPHLRTVSLAGYQFGVFSIGAEGRTARVVPGKFVSSSFFSLLDVEMQLGRSFLKGEDNPSDPKLVAIISDRLWSSLFDRDPGVLQKVLRVNGHAVTMIGVVSREFRGTEQTSADDLWLPGAATPIVNYLANRYDDRAAGGYYEFVARLSSGASWPQAEAELQSLAPWLLGQHPKENSKFSTTGFHLMGSIGTRPLGQRERLVRLIELMMAAGALVLLICCANVAGLLMIRGVGRRGEVAVRKALGAGRWQLLRQHLVEGLLLWAAGGIVAVLLVWTLTRTLEGSRLAWLGVGEASIPIDWRVVAFAAGLSLSAGVTFSLLPALRTARAEAIETIRSAGLTVTPRFLTGSVLTGVQLAASLTLLVGALLLVATLRQLSTVDVGFDPVGLTTVRLDPGRLGYKEADAWAYLQTFAQRLSARPGIESVSISGGSPFSGDSIRFALRRAGANGDESMVDGALRRVLSSGYFETVHLPLLRGRSFTSDEIGGPGVPSQPVVILAESFARRLFGTIDVLGETVETERRARYRVIGVARDIRTSMTSEPELQFYDPRGLSRGMPTSAVILVRAGETINVASEARTVGVTLNSAMPVGDATSVKDEVAAARSEWDLLTRLIGLLAIVAASLSAIGVYGVTAFAVASRRREFGIRMALGATPDQVRRLVMRRSVPLTVVSMIVGLGGAVGLTQMLKSRLVGVQPFDPFLWALAAAMLAAIVFLASLLPARAATRVSVAETLRSL